jgi:hypothetical protein
MTFEYLPFFLMRWGVHDNSLTDTIKKAKRFLFAREAPRVDICCVEPYGRKQRITWTGFGINLFT